MQPLISCPIAVYVMKQSSTSNKESLSERLFQPLNDKTFGDKGCFLVFFVLLLNENGSSPLLNNTSVTAMFAQLVTLKWITPNDNLPLPVLVVTSSYHTEQFNFLQVLI